MQLTDPRALIAEGREHNETFNDEDGNCIAWLRTNLRALLDGYAASLVEVDRLARERSTAITERLGAVVEADQFRRRLALCEEMRGTERDAARLQRRLRDAKGERDDLAQRLEVATAANIADRRKIRELEAELERDRTAALESGERQDG